MQANIETDVTEDDIKNGKKGDPCNCPVALSLKRVLGKGSITVGGSVLAVVNDDGFFRYEIPVEIEKLIHEFDAGVEIEPFPASFRLLDKTERARVSAKKISPHPDYARH
jgi:hypothetical protein